MGACRFAADEEQGEAEGVVSEDVFGDVVAVVGAGWEAGSVSLLEYRQDLISVADLN